MKNQVRGTQPSSIPSTEMAAKAPTVTLKACVLCKHSDRYFDTASGRCCAAWADFAACGCHCIFTELNPDSLIRAAPALYEALKEILNYGVEFDDVRLSHVVAHIDKDAVADARAALALAETCHLRNEG